MGTNANRTSTHQGTMGGANHSWKTRFQEGTALMAKTAREVSPKAFVWCRDHLLSVTVLMLFPMAIAGYYWSNATSETPPPPPYLALDDEKEPVPLSDPLPSGEAGLVSVTPETPMTLDAPQTLAFPMDSQGAELSFPQPLPANNALSQTEHTVPHRAPLLMAPGLVDSSGQCVWLTGTIEEFENSADHWDNASRVHDLTAPTRN